MIKRIFLILFLLLLSVPAFSQTSIAPPFCYEEEDGSPDVCFPTPVKVSNGSMTDNADGTISIKTVGTTTTTTKFCIDADEDTCWYKTDADTAVLTINDYVALKMIRTTEDYFLLLDDGVGGFKLLLDGGGGGFFLIIK